VITISSLASLFALSLILFTNFVRFESKLGF